MSIDSDRHLKEAQVVAAMSDDALVALWYRIASEDANLSRLVALALEHRNVDF